VTCQVVYDRAASRKQVEVSKRAGRDIAQELEHLLRRISRIRTPAEVGDDVIT